MQKNIYWFLNFLLIEVFDIAKLREKPSRRIDLSCKTVSNL